MRWRATDRSIVVAMVGTGLAGVIATALRLDFVYFGRFSRFPIPAWVFLLFFFVCCQVILRQSWAGWRILFLLLGVTQILGVFWNLFDLHPLQYVFNSGAMLTAVLCFTRRDRFE